MAVVQTQGWIQTAVQLEHMHSQGPHGWITTSVHSGLSIIWYIPVPAHYLAGDDFSFLMTVGWIGPILQTQEHSQGQQWELGVCPRTEVSPQPSVFQHFWFLDPFLINLEKWKPQWKLTHVGCFRIFITLVFAVTFCKQFQRSLQTSDWDHHWKQALSHSIQSSLCIA